MARNSAAAEVEKRSRKAQRLISFAHDSAGAQPDEVSAEVVSSKRFSQFAGAWRDLVSRAIVPNIFMSPSIVSAAGSSREIVVVLVWGRNGQDRRLEGVCALTQRTDLRSRLPIPVLSAKFNKHCFFSSPVVRRENPDPVLHAMFDAIAAETKLPKAVCLRDVTASGPMADALSRVLAARRSRLVTVAKRKRPVLDKKGGQTTYNDVFRSGDQRRNVRRLRRRLIESRNVSEVVYREPADIAAAIEEFLSLEGSGWKGSRGTALACDDGDSNFTRAWLTSLAVTRDLRVETLRSDGKAIAMWVWTICGDRAFTWKICYDERFSKFGPGVLALEQATRGFLVDDGLKFADSCTTDDTGVFGRYWNETMPVADIIFDVRQGGSILTTAMALLDKGLVDCKKRLWPRKKHAPGFPARAIR